jgi:aminoglycoside phosphotransferase (APT) family kinase protein
VLRRKPPGSILAGAHAVDREPRRDERPAYLAAMNRAIAALHRIEPASVGLPDCGKPGNYFARQTSRWSRPKPDATLPDRIPDDNESTIVHGDFRCDNMIFHPTEPRILAVLDALDARPPAR